MNNIQNTIKKKLILGSDHAAFKLKSEMIKFLLSKENYEVIDVGCDNETSCDYPEFAEKVCIEVLKDEKNSFGILLCGTGIGISIAANKISGIRCGLCHDYTTARLTREHNNANILAMGESITGINVAKDIVNIFLSTEFSGGENHVRRLKKIKELEEKYK